MYSATTLPGVDPKDFLGVFSDLGDLKRTSDAQPETALILVTSLVFLGPCLTALQLGRYWHAFLFGVMGLVCGAYHACAPGSGALGAASSDGFCPEGAAGWATHAYQVWTCVCLIQMAFLVLGPEDPQLQALGQPPAADAAASSQVQWDVVLGARVAPVFAMAALHLSQVWDTDGPSSNGTSSKSVYWQSILLAELLLVFGAGLFWAQWPRRAQAPEVLLRLKFWHRLLHHGVIPAMMLFWIFCITGFAGRKALTAMWHVVVAAFAMSILRTVRYQPENPTGEEVYDTTGRNPGIHHILLSSVALALLPTAIVGVSYDWCSTKEWHWPTVATASSCEPGGYFVAIAAVPAYVGGATIFWLLGSISRSRSLWTSIGTGFVDTWEVPYGLRQRLVGTDLGCTLGQAGAACGLLAALVQRGSPMQDTATLALTLASSALLTTAMVLTVTSADPSAPGYSARRAFTLFGCAPIAIVHAALCLAVKLLPAAHAFPEWAYAVSEYSVALAYAFWPLTWTVEVHEESQRKPSGTFAWPKTAWRFQ